MPPPDEHSFFVRGEDGEEYGPASLVELRQWVRENRIGLGSSVRPDLPDASWQPWQHYPELVALVAEAQASGAIPPPPPGALVVAPVFRRTAAFLLDLLLIIFLTGPIWRVTLAFCPREVYEQLPQLSPAYNALFTGIFCAVVTLYLTGFHWAHGQTPGKSLLRLRVVDRTGRKPDGGRALARGLVECFLLLLVGISIYFWFVPLLFIFSNPQRRGLHDLAAGTCVVEA